MKSCPASLSSLAIKLAIVTIFGGINPQLASAASLSFTPAGSQLDNDEILDIAVSSGQTLTFNVDFDPMDNTFSTIEYNFDFDTSELSLQNINAPNASVTGSAGELGVGAVGRITVPGGVDSFTDTFTFVVTNPGIAPHDGLRDFNIQIGTAIVITDDGDREDGRNLFFPQEQEVEVQTPEPNFLLGIFALTGLGLIKFLKRSVL